jgi:hypothetical protein
MVRPYIQKSIVELQNLFEANKGNSAELMKLAAELKHRKVPKAVALAKKVSDALAGTTSNEPKNDSGTAQQSVQPQPEGSIIDCQGCGQKLRIQLDLESREYSCPSCKSTFHASFSRGVLSVVFVKSEGTGTTNFKNEDAPITLNDAYSLFEADATSPWEMIELTRRRLIQQYHPDKVAALGSKLQVVAEVEVKRINVAYDVLRKAKGF